MKHRFLSHALLLGLGLAGGWAVTAMSGQDPVVATAAVDATDESEVVLPLETLDWMIGDWVAETDSHVFSFSCKFSKNNAFLIRSFQVDDKAEPANNFSGMQVVAWDPSQSLIRSWTFDANGGFGEDVWSQVGDKYTLRAKYTLPDGGKGAAIHSLVFIDDNSFGWKSAHREIDGELQPDVDEIVFQRVATDATASGN